MLGDTIKGTQPGRFKKYVSIYEMGVSYSWYKEDKSKTFALLICDPIIKVQLLWNIEFLTKLL